jgi:hypothetical protein
MKEGGKEAHLLQAQHLGPLNDLYHLVRCIQADTENNGTITEKYLKAIFTRKPS